MKKSSQIKLNGSIARQKGIFKISPLVLAIAIAPILTACEPEQPKYSNEAYIFENVNECFDKGFRMDVCESNLEKAKAAHLSSAPRFDSIKACEAEFGEGNCQGNGSHDHSTGQGNFFLPLMAGMMLGSMMNSNSFNQSRPLYRDKDRRGFYSGGYFVGNKNKPQMNNLGKSRSFKSYNGVSNSKGGSFASKSATVSRSGFGARSGSSSS